MVKQMFCKECNAPIDFSYITLEKQFSITEDGKIERSDNNISDDPYIDFYCSNDRAHEFGDSKELDEWMNYVTSEFYEKQLWF